MSINANKRSITESATDLRDLDAPRVVDLGDEFVWREFEVVVLADDAEDTDVVLVGGSELVDVA